MDTLTGRCIGSWEPERRCRVCILGPQLVLSSWPGFLPLMLPGLKPGPGD
jgi:hypothetical protein